MTNITKTFIEARYSPPGTMFQPGGATCFKSASKTCCPQYGWVYEVRAMYQDKWKMNLVVFQENERMFYL